MFDGAPLFVQAAPQRPEAIGGLVITRHKRCGRQYDPSDEIQDDSGEHVATIDSPVRWLIPDYLVTGSGNSDESIGFTNCEGKASVGRKVVAVTGPSVTAFRND